MKNHKKHQPKLAKHLRRAQQKLSKGKLDEAGLRGVSSELNAAEELAKDANDVLSRGLEMVARVSDLAASMQGDASLDSNLVDEFIYFLGQNVEVLGKAVDGEDCAEMIEAFIRSANESWEDYLSLFGDAVEDPAMALNFDEMDERWDDSFSTNEGDGEAESDDQTLHQDQIQMMLAALGSSDSSASETTDKQAAVADNRSTDTTEAIKEEDTATEVDGLDADHHARQELASDSVLLQAYLDDALRCLASMEQAAMAIEDSPQDHETARQFCRELHTLKGASGTVGLHGLASRLHELESSLETLFDTGNDSIDAEPLFHAVDQVRAVIESLQSSEPQEDGSRQETISAESAPSEVSQTVVQPTAQPLTRKPELGSFATDDASVRIRASKLDRLMDMLAELVVLRNRRESHVTDFNELNRELVRCSARVSFADEQTDLTNAAEPGNHSRNNLSEVAKDITAVSLGLRELQKPVVDDNLSISRFIRDFRQELMQLRRIPVSGLFSRLQRAARDAARSEGKRIRVQLEGQNAGLEQEIQEKLFDPLLHVVRNSVSHGVESPEDRKRTGKEENGIITLSAISNAQLLMIEVRDDGGGINYDAVRRRGIEKGLISADRRYTDDQLARLIFHPGFSTKTQASEISGRGVGMDVVATTIEKMRGRIEIESTPGEGTAIRLLVPLRTGIEHVMVFRTGEQFFALPMQSVTSAKSANETQQDVDVVSLATALSISEPKRDGQILMLRNSQHQKAAKQKRLALAVDELVGPEEVVVRNLPSMLGNHPLINGITLAGSGNKVLLLDSDRLVDFCLNSDFDLALDRSDDATSGEDCQVRVLVVDDSLTARKVMGKYLRKHGFFVVEAGDGMEAIEKLHRDTFDLVITDLDMPRMGGLELLADIENGNYCDAPRVVVSSRNEEKFRHQAADSGASEFLNKPLSESDVNDLLDRLKISSSA